MRLGAIQSHFPGCSTSLLTTIPRGGIVWCAGYILADHILKQCPQLMAPATTAPPRILELGAGTGITGIALVLFFPSAQINRLTLVLISVKREGPAFKAVWIM